MAQYDLIIIGGGAAGMMAACTAAAKGADVTLIERNSQLGIKINITKRLPLTKQWKKIFFPQNIRNIFTHSEFVNKFCVFWSSVIDFKPL